jgi:hypothetical protein
VCVCVSSDCVFLFLFRNVFLCVSCRYYYIKADEPFVRVTERRWWGVTSLPPPPNNLLMDVAHLFDSHPLCCRLPVCRVCVVFLGSETQRTQTCQMTFQILKNSIFNQVHYCRDDAKHSGKINFSFHFL